MATNKIEILIDRQRPGWTLEQPFYTDNDIFELEWERIIGQLWLFAGTTAEIPRPGDFFTFAVRNESVIIIRGDKGEVFAHHNTCRHRGSLICLNERGSSPKLMCPYHQWVYNKDGSLFKSRLMPPETNKAGLGLHPVKVEIVSGLIFISFSENAPDFDAVRNDLKPFLDPFRIDNAKVAYQKSYELRTNWKLVAENFRECYHCGIAHPEYCKAVVGANLTESAEVVSNERRVAWQTKGLAVDTVDFVNDSFHYAVRYPLRPGFDSYSLDGKTVSLPMGEHKDFDAGVLGIVLYPGFWMDAVSDYMWIMRVVPVSPSKTRIDVTWLVNGSAVEGVDYSVEKLTEFWKITGEQDWKLCENNYAGIESSQYVPGPYAPAEDEVAKFIRWYLDRLTMVAELNPS